jgi:hypothetical protein
VRARRGQERVAAAEVVHERDDVAHGPARGPQRVLGAEHVGDALLQTAHRGVAVEDVVAHLRGRHGGAHLLGRLGDGVRTEVDRGVTGRCAPGTRSWSHDIRFNQ